MVEGDSGLLLLDEMETRKRCGHRFIHAGHRREDPSQFFQHGEKGGEVGEAGKDKDIMWKRGRWEEWIFARGGRRPK